MHTDTSYWGEEGICDDRLEVDEALPGKEVVSVDQTFALAKWLFNYVKLIKFNFYKYLNLVISFWSFKYNLN